MAAAELRYGVNGVPVFQPIQIYVFGDTGYVLRRGALLPQETRSDTAYSAGMGVRWRLGSHLSGWVEYAQSSDEQRFNLCGTFLQVVSDDVDGNRLLAASMLVAKANRTNVQPRDGSFFCESLFGSIPERTIRIPTKASRPKATQ